MFALRHPPTVQAEPVEALPFFPLGSQKGQPFDRLRANGGWGNGVMK